MLFHVLVGNSSFPIGLWLKLYISDVVRSVETGEMNTGGSFD